MNPQIILVALLVGLPTSESAKSLVFTNVKACLKYTCHRWQFRHMNHDAFRWDSIRKRSALCAFRSAPRETMDSRHGGYQRRQRINYTGTIVSAPGVERRSAGALAEAVLAVQHAKTEVLDDVLSHRLI